MIIMFFFCLQMFAFASKSPITIDIIRKASYQVSQKHPLLRMCISKSDHPLRFHPLDDIGIKVQETTERSWVSAFDKELSSSFKYSDDPLWRILYCPDVNEKFTTSDYKYQCVLIVSIDHAIGDALSFTMMVGDLMTNIQSTMKNHTLSDDIQSQPLPSSVEVSQDMYTRLTYTDRLIHFVARKNPNLCRCIVNMLAPKTSQYRHSSVVNFLRKEEQYVKDQPFHVQFIHRSIDEQDTHNLLNKCKKNGISPPAVLLASFFLVINKYADIGKKQVKFLAGRNLVCKFENSKISFDLVNGSAFLGFTVEVLVNSGCFWEFAKKCYYDKDASLRAGEAKPASVELISAMTANVTDTAEGRADRLVCISNYGRCKWLERSDTSPIRLQSMQVYCNGGNFPNMPPFYIMCQTVNGKLFWNLHCLKIREKTANEIADAMCKLIREESN